MTGVQTCALPISPNNRVTVLLAQVIFIPSMLIGGVMMPTEMLSQNMQRISKILPTTHCMNALGAFAFNKKPVYSILSSIIVLLLGGILSFALAAYLFTWDSKSDKPIKNLIGFIALLPYIISIFI